MLKVMWGLTWLPIRNSLRWNSRRRRYWNKKKGKDINETVPNKWNVPWNWFQIHFQTAAWNRQTASSSRLEEARRDWSGGERAVHYRTEERPLPFPRQLKKWMEEKGERIRTRSKRHSYIDDIFLTLIFPSNWLFAHQNRYNALIFWILGSKLNQHFEIKGG